jgi:carboxypeptidase family protein
MFVRVVRLLMVTVVLVLPALASAQEATLGGTVVDSTGGVLPGAALTAVHEASGNTFEGVTDERGAYRIAARAGTYRLTVVMPGFGSVNRPGIELLVGQQVVVNFELSPSTVQESITVNADAPLLDLTSSSLGGNVDPRQTQELPVNGRDWLALTTLAPGMRANATDLGPTAGERMGNREFQLTIDGQEVSVAQGGNRGQPRFSRDAIGEFQFLSSRFDATQGRSSGLMVNAITKSGSNVAAGSFAATSVTTASMRRTSSRATSCRIRTSSSAPPTAGRSCGTGCTTSPITSTSASLGRRPSIRRIPASTSRSPVRVGRTWRDCGSTISSRRARV